MWDAVVVGARCAGASAALLLARRGHRVLLVDRTRFPSDTMSTLYIHQPGVALLDRWGVLDAVVASGCPAIDTITYRVEDVQLRGPVPPLGPVKATYAPRRHILDQILVDAAIDAGVEFADASSVAGLTNDDGRITGVRLATREGAQCSERTHLVVGADGIHSTVARLAGAHFTTKNPLRSCVYYSGWTGLTCGFSIVQRDGNSLGTVPTHDGVTLVLTYFPQREFASVRKSATDAHRACIREMAPHLDAEIRAGTAAVRLHGTGYQPNYIRQAAGPGWVLTGDAGLHQDSVSAAGITNAFIQAQLLDDELDCDLADHAALSTALKRFGRRRDDALAEQYHNTVAAAQLHVQDGRLALLREISAVPELVQRYFALLAGMISADEMLGAELAG